MKATPRTPARLDAEPGPPRSGLGDPVIGAAVGGGEDRNRLQARGGNLAGAGRLRAIRSLHPR